MPKYKRKDGIVEAVQWFKEMGHPLVKMTPSIQINSKEEISGYYHIDTPSGHANVYEGDWIVTRAGGDSYPVRPKVFETLYEKVEE